MTWRDLTDEQVREITRRAYRRYRRPLGARIAATIAERRLARLRSEREASDVEADNAVTLRAVELIGEGFAPAAAYDRAMREARKGGAS